MKRLILEVEGRAKVLWVDGDTVEQLRESFMELCVNDPVLKGRVKTHYPTFSSFNKQDNMELELENEEELQDGQKIRVFFAPFAAMDSQGNSDVERAGPSKSCSNTQPQTGASLPVDDNDINYMRSIGLRIPSNLVNSGKGNVLSNSNSAANSKQASTTTTLSKTRQGPGNETPRKPLKGTKQRKQTPKSATAHTTESGDSDNEDDSYTKSSETARNNNLSHLKELNIVDIQRVTLRPKAKRARKVKQGDENVEPTRKQPRRAVKSSSSSKPAESLPEQEQSEKMLSDDEHEQAVDRQLLFDSQPASKKRAPVKRKKAVRKPRLIGQVITKYTPLPPFPDDLKESLENGLVYISQTHTKKINDFLIKHIKAITGDLYPTVKENRILKSQVLTRIRNMRLPNPDFYKSKIIKSLSASLRNRRNWEQNKKEKYLAARELLKMAEFSTGAQSSQQTTIVLSPEEADQLLQQPVRSKETVIGAMAAAASITPKAIHNMTVQAAIETYPYLKQTDLLMQDFANRVEHTVETLQANFNSAAAPLATILSTQIPEDELSTALLIEKLVDYFEVDEKNFPCIQFCDVSIQANEVLENIPRGQAPALIITKNDEKVISGVVVFNQEPLYTKETSKASECVILLLAVYFVFNISYPQVYRKILLTLEYIVCGQTEPQEISPDLRVMFEKLSSAKKLLA